MYNYSVDCWNLGVEASKLHVVSAVETQAQQLIRVQRLNQVLAKLNEHRAAMIARCDERDEELDDGERPANVDPTPGVTKSPHKLAGEVAAEHDRIEAVRQEYTSMPASYRQNLNNAGEAEYLETPYKFLNLGARTKFWMDRAPKAIPSWLHWLVTAVDLRVTFAEAHKRDSLFRFLAAICDRAWRFVHAPELDNEHMKQVTNLALRTATYPLPMSGSPYMKGLHKFRTNSNKAKEAAGLPEQQVLDIDYLLVKPGNRLARDEREGSDDVAWSRKLRSSAMIGNLIESKWDFWV